MRTSISLVPLFALAFVACGGSDDAVSTGSSSASQAASSSSAGGGGGGASNASSSASQGGGGATASSSSGTGGQGMCPTGNDACSQCLAPACPDVYCPCANDPECVALGMCLGACDPMDNGCIKPCFAAHENAISETVLVGDCSATSCANDCPGGQMLDTCSKCLFTSCSQQMNDCLADSACYDLVMCANACGGDQGCQTQCGIMYSAGASKAQAIQNCMGSSCNAQCN